MTQNSQFYWYAVYTRSCHEDKVDRLLKTKSIHTFLPRIEVWSKRKDRKKKIHKALFPGYLFVNEIGDRNQYLEILKTPGVVRMLGDKNAPMSIPDIQIESIKKILESRTASTIFPYLRKGQKVRVTNGPLQGCEGIILDLKKRDRLIVSIDLLQRAVSVELNGADVELLVN